MADLPAHLKGAMIMEPGDAFNMAQKSPKKVRSKPEPEPTLVERLRTITASAPEQIRARQLAEARAQTELIVAKAVEQAEADAARGHSASTSYASPSTAAVMDAAISALTDLGLVVHVVTQPSRQVPPRVAITVNWEAK